MTTNPAPNPPPPQASTGRLVAIVVGVVVGVVLLTIAGLAITAFIFARKVTVSTVRDEQGREKTVKVDTPFGRLRVEKQADVDAKLLGIPIYPGAVQLKGDMTGARVDLDLDFADKYVRVLAVKMETTDPFDKVVDFYKEEAADFVFTRKRAGEVEFKWEQGRLKKVVGIVEKRGKTQIGLANIGEPEAN